MPPVERKREHEPPAHKEPAEPEESPGSEPYPYGPTKDKRMTPEDDDKRK